MPKYTKIPESTFKEIQLNAGILLRGFTPGTGELNNEDIIGATTGGVTFVAMPTYSDYGEDIDNCPKNTKELKQLDDWDVRLSGTFVTITTESAKRTIGAADIDASDATKVTPRTDLRADDFEDLWWVGDYSDQTGETGGGFVAVHMMNTLSTGGFQIQSGDKAKGQFSFEFGAHYSVVDQSTVPFEVYIKAGTAEE